MHWADPFLGATLVGPVVKGIQQNNVVVGMRMHLAALQPPGTSPPLFC
eukprot:COSAG01_NODE_834_length_13230_cov_18.826746_10_plen_48_part_00